LLATLLAVVPLTAIITAALITYLIFPFQARFVSGSLTSDSTRSLVHLLFSGKTERTILVENVMNLLGQMLLHREEYQSVDRVSM
jgi:hypothetical protein